MDEFNKPKKIKNVPRKIRDATDVKVNLTQEEALIKQGLTPEESVVLLIGNISKIKSEKAKQAEYEVKRSIISSSLKVSGGTLQKLLFLRDHFEINPNLPFPMWLIQLSLNLAETYIPGFSPPQTSGRPTQKNAISELKFLYKIEDIKAKNLCNDGEALKRYLIKNGVGRPSEGEIKTLRNRLSKSRNKVHSPLIKLVPKKAGNKVDLNALASLIDALDS